MDVSNKQIKKKIDFNRDEFGPFHLCKISTDLRECVEAFAQFE